MFFRCCDVDVKLMLCGVGWGGVGWDNNVNALAFSCTSTDTSCYAVDVMLKLCSCYVDAMFILR